MHKPVRKVQRCEPEVVVDFQSQRQLHFVNDIDILAWICDGDRGDFVECRVKFVFDWIDICEAFIIFQLDMITGSVVKNQPSDIVPVTRLKRQFFSVFENKRCMPQRFARVDAPLNCGSRQR